ncbi:MAG: SRPBCC family protein [Acidimicrobiales bacterium]
MACYETTTDIAGPPDELFSILADYTNAAEWNPAYVSVEQTEGEGPGLGARYSVVFNFYGRHFDIDYEVTEFVQSERVVLTGTSKRVRARDEMVIKANGSASLVHRVAELSFTGPIRLLDGGLQVAFESISKRARERLGELSAA